MTAPAIILSDGREFSPGRGGAGSPDLAFIDPKSQGRHYVDPLPWDEFLGALGYPRETFERNKEFRSVTTALGELPTHALVAWSGRMSAECSQKECVRQWRERFGPDFERTLVRWIAQAGERVRDRAGERGTAIHDIAEDGEKIIHFVASELLEQHEIHPWFVEVANCAPYVKALIKFFEAYPGIIPLWVEVSVFNRALGIAGTLDLIAWVPGLGIVLLDWKTSNTLQPKFSFQEAGYAYAEYAIVDGQRCPLLKVDGHYVVHLMPGDPDDAGVQHGAFEVVPMDPDPGQLEIFKAMEIVRRWAHPSRIGRPLPHPGELGLSTMTQFGHQRPELTVVRPHEAAAAFVAGHWEELPRALAESVFDDLPPAPAPAELPWEYDCAVHARTEDCAEHRDACRLFVVDDEIARQYDQFMTDERAWFKACVEYVFAQTTGVERPAEAQYLANSIATFWQGSGVPPLASELFGYEAVTEYVQLLDMVQQAADQLSMPFLPRPVQPDWVQLRTDLELAAIPPKPTMSDLGALLLAVQAGTVEPPQGRVVTLAKRAYSIDPDKWGKPADPSLVEACTALADRASQLPRDMIEALDAWKLDHGLPNLRTISMTREHLDLVACKVDEMHDEWSARIDAAYRVVMATVSHEDHQTLVDCLLDNYAKLAPTMEACTAVELERIKLVCRGMQRGDVAMTVDDAGAIGLVSAVDPVKLVGRYGTKNALRDVCRELCATLDIPTPRSAADCAANVVLVAALGEADEAAADMPTDMPAAAVDEQPGPEPEQPSDRLLDLLPSSLTATRKPDDAPTFEIGEGIIEP